MLLLFVLLICFSCFGLTEQEQNFLKNYGAQTAPLKRLILDQKFSKQIAQALERHWENKKDTQDFMISMATTIALFDRLAGTLPESIQKIKNEIIFNQLQKGRAEFFEQIVEPLLAPYDQEIFSTQLASAEYMRTYFNALNTYLDPLETDKKPDQLLLELLQAIPADTVYTYAHAGQKLIENSLIFQLLKQLDVKHIEVLCKQMQQNLSAKDALARILLLKYYSEQLRQEETVKILGHCSEPLLTDIAPFLEYIVDLQTALTKQTKLSKELFIRICEGLKKVHFSRLADEGEKKYFDELYLKTFLPLTRDTIPALFEYRADKATLLSTQYLNFMREFFIISKQRSVTSSAELANRLFGWQKKECSTFPLKTKIDLANYFVYESKHAEIFASFKVFLEQQQALGNRPIIDFNKIELLTSSNANTYFAHFQKETLEPALTFFYQVKNVRELSNFIDDKKTQYIAENSALVAYTICYLADVYNNLINDRQACVSYRNEILGWAQTTGFGLTVVFKKLGEILANVPGHEIAHVDTSLKYIFGIPQERKIEFDSAETQVRLHLVNAYLNGVYVYQIVTFYVPEEPESKEQKLSRAQEKYKEIADFLEHSFTPPATEKNKSLANIYTYVLRYIQQDPSGLLPKISPEETEAPPLQQLYQYLAYLRDRFVV